MRALAIALSLGCMGLAGAAIAQTPQSEASAQTRARYSTAETRLGVLLDDPASHAVLQRRIPGLLAEGRINLARGMTLHSLQRYAHERLTDETLAQIDADLAAIAPR